jgi:hypothetical protein
MATRNSTPPPDGDTQTSGFTEEQRGELRDLISEVVGGAKPPTVGPKEKVGPAMSDSEWDAMSDRQRESWVRKLVDFRLDELARDDEIARQRADIDDLKNQKPEPEATPSIVTKLQKWLWGEPDK